MASRVVSSRLARTPLTITTRWTRREYATRRPVPARYDQWRAEFEIESATEILLVLVLHGPEGSTFGKLHRGGAGTSCRVGLTFMWHDWAGSDLVRLSLAQGAAIAQLDVEDRELGTDPRRYVELLPEPDLATTGTAVTLATVERAGVRAEAVCVAKADTTNTHGRWALRRELRDGVDERYAFLCAGAVGGTWT